MGAPAAEVRPGEGVSAVVESERRERKRRWLSMGENVPDGGSTIMSKEEIGSATMRSPVGGDHKWKASSG